jgi:formylmethanofuran dehydrogenase subunit E
VEKIIEKCEWCSEKFCGDGEFEIKGKVICFACYEDTMDEALFGDPFGEW